MQIERKITNLFDYFAEMPLICYKDNANERRNKIKTQFLNEWMSG